MVSRFLTIILIVLSVYSYPGCNNKPAPSVFPDHLMVNYTSKTEGSLYPCGCRIPLGGLSRRGGVLSEESPYPQLTLDAGSFIGGNTGYDRFAASYILKAYLKMGYQAVNAGRRESNLTISHIRELDAVSEGMMVSANLKDDTGLPVTRTHLVREIGGIKIGITGITSMVERPEGATELPVVGLPVDSLTPVLDEMKTEGVDFVVLLADTGIEEIMAILEKLPDFDLIIQGQEYIVSDEQKIYTPAHGVQLVNIGGAGKYLGRLRIDFDPSGTVTGGENFRVDLDSFAPTLSSVTEVLMEFKTQVRERREEFLGDPANPFQRSQSPELIDVLSGYTGEAFCMRCHPGYGTDQMRIGHTTTWARLPEDKNKDPECLPCHTTGYGQPTGLEDVFRDSHLQGVTCESCHGPAAGHVREMTAVREGYDQETLLEYQDPTGLPFSGKVPEEVCLKCHTEEWSPDFNYEAMLPKINHEDERNRVSFNDPATGLPIEPEVPEGVHSGDPE